MRGSCGATCGHQKHLLGGRPPKTPFGGRGAPNPLFFGRPPKTLFWARTQDSFFGRASKFLFWRAPKNFGRAPKTCCGFGQVCYMSHDSPPLAEMLAVPRGCDARRALLAHEHAVAPHSVRLPHRQVLHARYARHVHAWRHGLTEAADCLRALGSICQLDKQHLERVGHRRPGGGRREGVASNLAIGQLGYVGMVIYNHGPM